MFALVVYGGGAAALTFERGDGVPVDIMREESGNEPVAAFSMSHPAVPALYIVLTLGLTMFSMQPVLIALSLAGGLAYGFAMRGAARTLGALRWQLPVILIIALLNPLFSASRWVAMML